MRSIKLIIFAVLFSVLSVATVNAATNTTGVVRAPGLTPGSTVNTTVYELTTENSSKTVTGPNTTVIYSGFAPLADRYDDADGRTLTIKLFEADQYPNEDDLVKTYTWTFEKRDLAKVSYVVNDPGNIDSAGDPTAELYLSFYLKKMPKDANTRTNSILYYNITVR